MTGNRIERNIICDAPKALGIDTDAEDIPVVLGASDYNLFFAAADGPPRFGLQQRNLSWPEWQAKGYDRHSLVADPRFIDSEHDDYRLKPESPALKLGFQPIDVDAIGPRKP